MLNSTVLGNKTHKQSKWAVMALLASLLNVPTFSAQAATLSTVFAFDLHLTAAGVVEGDGTNAGFLFGTTNDSSLTYGGAIFKAAVGGGVPQVLYQLDSTNGYSPQATLLLSTDHRLYGTTRYAPRVGTQTAFGAGTIFRIAQDGTAFTTLHVFSNDNSEGAFPDYALIEDQNYLYGVTIAYGVSGPTGAGTVFRLRKSDGLFQVLHRFPVTDSTGGNATGEGATPSSSLTLASNGRLYGVTSNGGSNLVTTSKDANGNPINVGAGTIYSLNIDGTGFQTVYQFHALDKTATASDGTTILSYNADGAQPNGNLLETSTGVLVGTTTTGGNPQAGAGTGYGTVFSFNINTATLSNLYAFDNVTGASPFGSLVMDPISGLVFGLTQTGSGATSQASQYGNLFHINPTTTTADFGLNYSLAFAEGTSLNSGLMRASNGDLFFSASSGNGCTALNGTGYGAVLRYSLATNASASGYSNCTPAQTSSGGGAMNSGWLWLLATLGLAPSVRRRAFSLKL